MDVLLIGNECPKDMYLNKFVRDEICVVWWDLGVVLMGQEEAPSLNVIKEDHHGDVKKCCSAMFSLWRQRHPKANWDHLIVALKEVKLHSLANKLENLLSPHDEQEGMQESDKGN